MVVVGVSYMSMGAMQQTHGQLARKYDRYVHDYPGGGPSLPSVLARPHTQVVAFSQEDFHGFAYLTGISEDGITINGEWELQRHHNPPTSLGFLISAPRNDCELMRKSNALETAGNLYVEWQKTKNPEAKMSFENMLLDAAGITNTAVDPNNILFTKEQAGTYMLKPATIFQSWDEIRRQQREVLLAQYRSMYRLLVRTVLTDTPKTDQVYIGPSMATANRGLTHKERAILGGTRTLEECVRDLPADLLEEMIKK